MRILIIDDNDDVAALYAEILTSDGFEVDRTAAAYGAVLRAMSHRYDLVIMDLLLQGTNGAVAALALRGLGVTAPIIVITGGLMPIDDRVYAAANFAGRMLKPVLLDELISEVRRQLGLPPKTKEEDK